MDWTWTDRDRISERIVALYWPEVNSTLTGTDPGKVAVAKGA